MLATKLIIYFLTQATMAQNVCFIMLEWKGLKMLVCQGVLVFVLREPG
jgi:hypothetical protein